MKIKEITIEGNKLVFHGEDGREYGVGCDPNGMGLVECEIIMFEKKSHANNS